MVEDIDQEKASRCLYNNSLIISGAGCGKTTTLIKKISKLIEHGTNEEDILVISFTNETVNSFKQKCPFKVDVFTFHKLSLKYIYEENYSLVPENLLDEIIQKVLLSLPKKLKIKVYNMFNKRILKLNKEKYNSFIISKKSSSIFPYIKSIISTVNSENISVKSLNSNTFSKNESIILYICQTIINLYNKEKKENEVIDFDDMLKMATLNLKNNIVKCKYKFILVDEYQDISKIRRDFLKALLENSQAVLTAVGDDFQSIYGFSGSNIKLFYDFQNNFKNSHIFFIRKTYRCPANIINIAGKFVMKNKLQMKKELISNISNYGRIKFYEGFNTRKIFKKLVINFINKESTFILSRNNFDIDKFIDKDIKFKNSYLVYKNIKYNNVRFLTIHKAKGLEAENVVIINLTKGLNGLPSLKKNNIIDKIKNNKESIKYAEERRLMYVAMTRTRQNLCFLIDENNKSIFVKEIKKLTHKS